MCLATPARHCGLVPTGLCLVLLTWRILVSLRMANYVWRLHRIISHKGKLFCADAERRSETNQNTPHHPRSVPWLGTVLGNADATHSVWSLNDELRSTSAQNNFSQPRGCQAWMDYID
ncbi:hypothetical protein MA16_Dca001748 [Dendrobium catenatum]|uniref:Uncharacterized protein n=1 Tax=Dendrobium catenatum TaxID=906689 RepID=A0A2I0XDA8_9ASPA|nr:hypothetical protein MA16_Dca001748 [Dendrobium catenatum]